MIEKSQAFEVLVESCPSFSPRWAAHRAEWGDDMLYVAAGEFAEHLLAIYIAGDQTHLDRAAAAIERLHTEGSPWVRDLAIAGVLEGVQNVWGNCGEDPEEFGKLLPPSSREAWNALNASWSRVGN